MDMHVGLEESIEIYARACRAWYGPKACAVAQETAGELRERGDKAGAAVWERVAEAAAGAPEPRYHSAFR